MEAKKNPVLALERERPLFTLLGFVPAFAITFVCFSLTVGKPDTPAFPDDPFDDPGLMHIPVFKIEEEKPLAAEKKKLPASPSPLTHPVISEKPVTRQPDPVAPAQTEPAAPSNTPEPSPAAPVNDEPYLPGTVDQDPEFPGGTEALERWLIAKTVYPAAAILYGMQGRVTVSFIIEKDGSVSHVRTEGAPLGYDLEQEAVRVVRALPRFRPGMKNKKPVRVMCRMPLDFVLPDETGRY